MFVTLVLSRKVCEVFGLRLPSLKQTRIDHETSDVLLIFGQKSQKSRIALYCVHSEEKAVDIVVGVL